MCFPITEIWLVDKVLEKLAVVVNYKGIGESLQQLLEWCRIGPLRAKVENIEVTEQSLQGFEKFKIIK